MIELLSHDKSHITAKIKSIEQRIQSISVLINSRYFPERLKGFLIEEKKNKKLELLLLKVGIIKIGVKNG